MIKIMPYWMRPFLPFWRALLLPPWGILIKEEFISHISILIHENIHFRQCIEMGIIFWYIWYFIEWLIRIIQYGKAAYRNISFEREAYANQHDVTYLGHRKWYSSFKYL